MRGSLLLVVLCLLLPACSIQKEENPLSEQIVQTLTERYGDVIDHNCLFAKFHYPRFYLKPEFGIIRDERLCEGEFVIRDTELFNQDSLLVSFQIVYTGNRRVLRNFLRSWTELVKRYERLDSLLIPDHRYGYAWTYEDPFDTDLFIRFPHETGGIFSTQQWLQLEYTYEWLKELYNERRKYSDTIEVMMVKNMDTWEIIADDNLR